ncbi:predicted protein [Plenodomus lingam JN3]|uniref:Predicted protein n=1 Tax=Leptosphaeria maculans (strain JN3 / isolate v23.1.3 / race Av1-4-5-6-7-8) TaxID=985895 RepID=E4ZHK8_LEPMJ|nr:predicted protein [Plenodomus lingam JN3]CBX90841.1 predicted protein [Plenodomus lingam JN3]
MSCASTQPSRIYLYLLDWSEKKKKLLLHDLFRRRGESVTSALCAMQEPGYAN